LVWVQLILIGMYGITVAHVVSERLLTADASVAIDPDAVWGMVAFATVPVLGGIGAVRAAWQSRRLPDDDPWDTVDVDAIGGRP
jgi:hypothetical protein